MASSKEGALTADPLSDLFAALVDAVIDSDTLLLLDRSPPDETDSPSITVGTEKGEETQRLSVTLEPDSGQLVFRGVYWRTGQFTPDMRERHGLLFPPAVFRLEDDGYGFSDPRQDDSVEVERYHPAREAAGFLFGLLEHFYEKTAERSD